MNLTNTEKGDEGSAIHKQIHKCVNYFFFIDLDERRNCGAGTSILAKCRNCADRIKDKYSSN